MTTHEYNYLDDEIPSFMWHEEGKEYSHSIPLGGTLVIDFAVDGSIMGFELYDLTNGVISDETLEDDFKEEGTIEITPED